MNKPKYPMSLFIVGVVMNFVVRHLLLFLAGLILIIVMEPGSFFHYVGIVMLVFDFLLSLGLQMGIRKEVMSESDNPDIQRIQAALSKEGRWVDNVKDIVDDKLDDYEDRLEEKMENKKRQAEEFDKYFDPDDESEEEKEEALEEYEEAEDIDETDSDDDKPHHKKVIYEDQEDDVEEESSEDEDDDEESDSERDK